MCSLLKGIVSRWRTWATSIHSSPLRVNRECSLCCFEWSTASLRRWERDRRHPSYPCATTIVIIFPSKIVIRIKCKIDVNWEKRCSLFISHANKSFNTKVKFFFNWCPYVPPTKNKKKRTRLFKCYSPITIVVPCWSLDTCADPLNPLIANLILPPELYPRQFPEFLSLTLSIYLSVYSVLSLSLSLFSVSLSISRLMSHLLSGYGIMCMGIQWFGTIMWDLVALWQQICWNIYV